MAVPLKSDGRRRLDACQTRVNYTFREERILCEALTHASGAESRVLSNERLEFLGDAILGMVVCEELYDRFPKMLEGELTRIKSVVVSRDTCARISMSLDLGELLFLGKGMSTQSSLPNSLHADVFESLVAAIYLDGGMECARQFIATHVYPYIDDSACISSDENYKSQLQHVAQRDFGRTPTYAVLSEEGPDHSKSFMIAARLGDQHFEGAWGLSKKSAEQLAAKNALEELGRLNHKE
jgi:ribonuclease-3